MSLHRVRCEQVEAQPWRNGAGRTRELLAWPQPDDWQLRISVADIDRNAAFSAYPGVDRWFAVLEGAGVLLDLHEGLHSVEIDSPPLHFRGEEAPACELLDGPTRDLNLMTQRHRGRATMQRAVPGVDFHARSTLRALFCADAATLQIDGNDARTLAPYTLLWADGGAHGLWRLHSEVDRPRAWWMSFEPSGAA
jgi:environmental stress-induced protein Ves